MTTKTFRLTPIEFEAFCNAELDKCLPSTVDETNDLIMAMSLEDYGNLCTRVRSMYRCAYEVMAEIATFFRDGFDPFNDAGKDDPLKSEPMLSKFLKYRDIPGTVCWDRFNGLPGSVEKNKAIIQRRLDEAKEAAMNVKVGDRNFRAELSCDVLWSGWECDATAWVVNDDGVRRLVASSHGAAYFAEASFLEERIVEYRAAIAASEGMLALLEQNERV